MDLSARYELHPPRVIFEFVSGHSNHFASISIEALAVLHHSEVSAPEQAMDAYRKKWRVIHSAAIGLLVREGKPADVTIEDVK